MSENLQVDEQLIANITKSVVEGLQTKAPAAGFTATPLHGVTGAGAGIFSTAGLDPDIISTVVVPFGLAAELPMFPSVFTDPRYGALTGVSDDIGSEPVNPCDAAPTGYIKACNLTAQFGRVNRDTETIEWDQVMLRINRGDFVDLRLIGQILGTGPFTVDGLSEQDVLNIVTMSEMMQAGVRTERKLNKIMWSGSPANNTAGGGYKEFPGLDNQIVTGQVDADTNTLCPSLDSDVKDFAFDLLGGSGRDIVEYVSSMEYFIRTLAEDTGMAPVRWAFVMRQQLWQELSSVWPILYNTDPVNTILNAGLDNNNVRVMVNGTEQISMRDQMRARKEIVVNGATYPVIVDTGITELTNVTSANLQPGEYASAIYMVPLTVTGNFPVTYMEHVDYTNAVAMANTALLRGKERFWTTNGGRFAWGIEDLKAFCYKLTLKTEPRVILRTPQLAGKIENIKYSPLQHVREPDPSDPYFVNGGVSTRAEPTKNAAWLS